MGIDESKIISVKCQMWSAVHSVIKITGAMFLKLSATGRNNLQYNARAMMYISPHADAVWNDTVYWAWMQH